MEKKCLQQILSAEMTRTLTHIQLTPTFETIFVVFLSKQTWQFLLNTF